MKTNRQRGNANGLVLLILFLMIISGLVVGLFATGHWIPATLIITHLVAILVGIPIGAVIADA